MVSRSSLERAKQRGGTPLEGSKVSSERYRILLIPEASGSLVPTRGMRCRRARARPPEESLEENLAGLAALMRALQRLGRRGPGPSAWAPVLEDPLSFVLDGMSDALVVRGQQGQLMFANRQAHELRLTERGFSTYEEFERGGEFFQSRGLQVEFPDGSLTFTLVSRKRR